MLNSKTLSIKSMRLSAIVGLLCVSGLIGGLAALFLYTPAINILDWTSELINPYSIMHLQNRYEPGRVSFISGYIGGMTVFGVAYYVSCHGVTEQGSRNGT